MNCDAPLMLENCPPPPIFKRHNAFQWTMTLPLTLGVFIPLVFHVCKQTDRDDLLLYFSSNWNGEDEFPGSASIKMGQRNW